MEILVVVNDAPYASERPYNALRLATSLSGQEDAEVRLFFLGDGAWCAVAGQPAPEGAHDIEWMVKRFVAGGRAAGVCRTCLEARGIPESSLLEGTHRSTLDELTAWTFRSDRVLVF